jgi:membrane-associated protease RseP (regulator of RpoE activity)
VKDPLAEIEVDRRSGSLGLIAFFAVAIVGLFTPMAGWIVFLAGMAAVIFMHELAHFVTAKKAGMKVTEFFVGFGPRLWSVRKGETEYGLKLVPAGGYCKIIGMTNLDDIDPVDEPRTYRSKKFLPKVIVAGAGSAMHFFLAFLAMFAVLLVEGNLAEVKATTTVDRVVEGTAADRAGIEPGDVLVSVDGAPINEFDDLGDLVEDRAGDVATVVVMRDGVEESFTVTIGETTDEQTGQKKGLLGVGPEAYVPELSVGGALIEAPKQLWEVGSHSVGALAERFSPSGISDYVDAVTGDESKDDERFISAVGAQDLAEEALEDGWVTLMGFFIAINVFVGLFNLLPVLPFDGGHIAIATYEKIASMITRRKVVVDVEKLLPLTATVVAILGLIFLSSLFLDVARPIEPPY